MSTEVTAVRLLKNGRYGLFCGEAFLLSLSAGSLLDAGVAKGDVLEEARLEKLRAVAALDRAKDKALRMLALRDHARDELTRKIARTEGQETAEAAVRAMEQDGLIDDAAFAEEYANELFGRRLFGRRRVEYELCRKGVARALAEKTCAALDRSPVRRAAALIQKKYPRAVRDEREKRRALAALERAGYDWETARDALRLEDE